MEFPSWRIAAVAFALAASQRPPASRQIVVVHPALHQFEDGPAVSGGQAFLGGETVFLSFQLNGYTVSDQSRVLVSHRIEIFDAAGAPLVPAADGKVDAELAPEDKNWIPKVRHNFELPPFLDPGVCRVVAVVKDELGGSSARQEIPFRVHGVAVAPSESLVVRNFRFLRSEESSEPVAAYRPSDTVWGRFEITGFRFGPKNRYEVEYGIAVHRAGGEVLYQEPKAADEQGETFYRKRYLPGALSLNLEKNIAAGEYTVIVTVRDRIGRQSHEVKEGFRVE